MIEIYDNVETFDDAINMLGCYGNVDIELDLKQVTIKETASVTLQEWHQDGSHVRYFPKYSALWCEKCDESSPVTQIISTRLSDDVAEKYKNVMVTLDFKKTINDNTFFKFETKAQARLYSIKANKTPMNLIEKDEKGYYTRWCPFTKITSDNEQILKEIGDIVLSQDITEVAWKPKRLLFMENKSALHRRKPDFNVNGERILWRAYIR